MRADQQTQKERELFTPLLSDSEVGSGDKKIVELSTVEQMVGETMYSSIQSFGVSNPMQTSPVSVGDGEQDSLPTSYSAKSFRKPDPKIVNLHHIVCCNV